MGLRRLLRALFGRVLELFFRRIEVAGAGRVPAHEPVLFAINHPNALIDPLLLLCYAPRPVSFLAKAPLFSMPVIGWFVRALDSIPVYRRQDQDDLSKNRETFARARSLLARGGTIAIAPEGVSHSEPSLRPLKTGAARIALGAAVDAPVAIVPVGLFYTDKALFRSGALLYFGEPLWVGPAEAGPDGEPDPAVVDRVTAELTRRLETVVIQADEQEAALVAARLEPILSAAVATERGLEQVLSIRQRLVAGYRQLRDRHPELLDRTLRRVDRLERAFREANLDADRPTPSLTAGGFLRTLGALLGRIVIFLPLALPGLVIHYPAYRLIRPLAKRSARGHDDVIATNKIAAGALLYPLTWLIVAIGLGWRFGWWAGLAGLGLAPIAGYAALRLVERFDRFLTASRAIGLRLFDRERLAALLTERDALRRDLIALSERLDPT